MKTKTKRPKDLQEASRLLGAGKPREALRIATKIKYLGAYRDPIQTAWASLRHPDFYLEMERDLDALFQSGIRALKQLIAEKAKR